MSSLYKEKAEDAIHDLFGDVSQPPEQTLEDLCHIRDQVKTLIAALREDLATTD